MRALPPLGPNLFVPSCARRWLRRALAGPERDNNGTDDVEAPEHTISAKHDATPSRSRCREDCARHIAGKEEFLNALRKDLLNSNGNSSRPKTATFLRPRWSDSIYAKMWRQDAPVICSDAGSKSRD